MKQIYSLLSLPLVFGASCRAATVAEMSGTVFNANGSGATSASQPLFIYLAIGMALLYFVLRQARRV